MKATMDTCKQRGKLCPNTALFTGTKTAGSCHFCMLRDTGFICFLLFVKNHLNTEKTFLMGDTKTLREVDLAVVCRPLELDLEAEGPFFHNGSGG